MAMSCSLAKLGRRAEEVTVIKDGALEGFGQRDENPCREPVPWRACPERAVKLQQFPLVGQPKTEWRLGCACPRCIPLGEQVPKPPWPRAQTDKNT